MLTGAIPSQATNAPTSIQEIAEAIALTVAYSDIFDHGPSIGEVHRLLIGLAVEKSRVEEAIECGRVANWIDVDGGFCYLRGRGDLAARRNACEATAGDMWRAAHRWAGLVSASPFVRMVAVTGALAMNNVEPGDDVDLFVVAQPGRLWLSRAFIVAMARLSQRVGPTICPNFIVTPYGFEIPDRNLFTARELFQMVPISGYFLYCQLLQMNNWAKAYLPNAGPRPIKGHRRPERPPGRAQRGLEVLLAGRVGGALEHWEMSRKIAKLRSRHGPGGPTVDFRPDACRGHFEGHDRRTLEAFAERRRVLGLAHRPVTIDGAEL